MTKKQLEGAIKYHNKKYYEENSPEISDIEYDSLVEQLRSIDPDNELVNGFFQELALSDKKKKVVKGIDMMSLDKAYSIEDVINWAEKYKRSDSEIFTIQPKYDGISANYEKHRNLLYTRARSKEEFGIDLSDKIPILVCITGNPPEAKCLFDIEKDVRGEILIRQDIFNSNRHVFVRSNTGEQYKTTRSAAAGILGRDNVDMSLLGYIHFVDFNVYSIDSDFNNLNNAITYAKEEFKKLGFPMDGIVIKIKDIEYRKSLGTTTHHPRGELALKPKNPTGETTLIDIELSIGKSAITPVGIVEPVEIAGNVNSRVSLHNWKFIIDNDIQIGDRILIQKAGEIIPQYHSLVERTKNSKKINIPEKCPNCESKLVWDGPNLRCINSICEGTLLKKLTDSIKRIGIENIGPSTVCKMISDLGCKDLIDIFNLKKEDILKLDNFADISSNNLILEIEKVKNNKVHDWRVLASLNIEGVGRSLSKIILKEVSFDLLRRLSENQLTELSHIGPERARDIFNFLKDNKKYIDDLLKIIKIESAINISTNQPKEILNICFTGAGTRKREEYFSIVESKGHVPGKTLTKKTHILVTDNPNKVSNKMKDAQKFGTKIISYEQFEQLVGKL